jgi:methionine biosynthesis protein MetW
MTSAHREKLLSSDYDQVISLVTAGASVLDLGCGNGELLRRLTDERHVRGMGVEISEDAVVETIRQGLSVFQGNIDEGLADYGDASYDFVILNQTLQIIRRPAFVIEEMLRVGKKAIISFPNFGHWSVRLQLGFRGRMPRTRKLPFEWHDTPNIHLLTIRDFVHFCRKRRIRILEQINLLRGRRRHFVLPGLGANLLADEGLFVLARADRA